MITQHCSTATVTSCLRTSTCSRNLSSSSWDVSDSRWWSRWSSSSWRCDEALRIRTAGVRGTEPSEQPETPDCWAAGKPNAHMMMWNIYKRASFTEIRNKVTELFLFFMLSLLQSCWWRHKTKVRYHDVKIC